MTYKLWDKVRFKWHVCTYVCEYREKCHLIDWVPTWHYWRDDVSITRAEKNNYTFVWEKYYFVDIDDLSPVQNKKVTDLTDQEVIHCETLEEAERICKIMHDAWLERAEWDSYLNINSWWSSETGKEGVCYRPNRGTFGLLKLYKERNYTIHPSKDFIEEIKEWDVVFIDDKWLTQKTPTPFYNLKKTTMTKLAAFRNALYFTDKKMESLAELTQEGSDVASCVQNLITQIESIQVKIKEIVKRIEDGVDSNEIETVKDCEKALKQIIKSIKEDKTMEVLLSSAEVVREFNEGL